MRAGVKGKLWPAARWLVAGLVVLSCTASVRAAELIIPHLFGSHMVVQCDQPVPVWGWAGSGDTVKVEFAGQSKTATTGADGAWKVTLDAMPASAESRKMTIQRGSDAPVMLDDVLVGEVWLCSGQSNMEWVVGNSNNADEEATAAAQLPQIRHIKVPKKPADQPQRDFDGAWTVCATDTVKGFTAAGYFFARKIHQELKVPVGLINSSWGGTRIEPWTPPVGFNGLADLKAIAEKVTLATPSSSEHKALMENYLKDLDAWSAKARGALAKSESVEAAPAFPASLLPLSQGPGKHQEPTVLYNGMLAPVVGCAMRGSLWYQGESNHGEGMLYVEKTKALVGGWRKVWGIGEFPYYFVQIAPYQYGNENPQMLPVFWEAQAAIETAVPNTGMVVISDIGNIKDIHPRNKQDVGLRLANLALAKTYGRSGIVTSGPKFKEMKIEGDKLRIVFTDVGGGLASRDGKPLSHFEILGEGTGFEPADAAIDGETVVLSSSKVAKPCAMRFAWDKLAEPNLMNKEGLPAGAFRAGEVPDLMLALVPEAKDYKLVYALDLGKLGKSVKYDEDHAKEISGKIDRIAYFIELQKGNESQHLFVSMDAFTQELGKIGVPTLDANATFQQKAANLNVISNVSGVKTGSGQEGFLEFWPNNYAGGNQANVPGASSAVYDFGDQKADPVDGYGSMQVHSLTNKQTLFAINNWKAGGNADIGIGNSEGENRDWTFMSNGGSYPVKKLRVLVRLAK